MSYKIINEVFSLLFVLSLWSRLYFIHEHFCVWTSRVPCAPEPGTAAAVAHRAGYHPCPHCSHRGAGTRTRNRGKRWLKGAEEPQGHKLGSCFCPLGGGQRSWRRGGARKMKLTQFWWIGCWGKEESTPAGCAFSGRGGCGDKGFVRWSVCDREQKPV